MVAQPKINEENVVAYKTISVESLDSEGIEVIMSDEYYDDMVTSYLTKSIVGISIPHWMVYGRVIALRRGHIHDLVNSKNLSYPKRINVIRVKLRTDEPPNRQGVRR